eukprot:537517_1
MEAVVADLVGMGFDKETVIKALRAANNNPDRAVEYLIGGIPNTENQNKLNNINGGGNDVQSKQHAMVAQLAQQNPQLLTAIQQNPQALQQVLQDPNIMQQLSGMMLLQDLQQQNQQQPPKSNGVIQVTQDEKNAIERLKAMGYSKNQAVEAYMVCGKNEEMAANY